MKKITYIILFGLLTITACNDDILDKQPLDLISDNTLWNDPILINGYLIQLYAEVSVFTNESTGYTKAWSGDWLHSEQMGGPFYINEISDESRPGWGAYIRDEVKPIKAGGLKIEGGLLEYWERPYLTIRSINEFLEKIVESPIEEPERTRLAAEARFLRAFNYFSMVKRYGGVPIITVAQNIDDSNETLYPSRDKEQDVYDFVISEIDAIVDELPEVAEDYGRATKYAALALKCRTALYAGSIAQHGTLQLDGVLGIPSNLAEEYYQKSYDAAKAIMDSGLFALYNEDEDKVVNFKNIFLVKNNSETIFAKRHNETNALNAGGNSWGYDFFQAPKPHSWNAGNQDAPYLEMVEEFEYIDGTPGTLDRAAIQEGLWSTEELWGNKDPRFFATIWTIDTPWKGILVDSHNGLILPDGSIITDGEYNGILALGPERNPDDNSYMTSFGVMKYLDENADNSNWLSNSSTDYTVFRYGEILLNFAEAAFELDRDSEALNAVNEIRRRAGIATLDAIDREKIYHERKVELAFEGHRYWDLRRWRIAVDKLTRSFSGIRYILDYTTRKYKIEIIENVDGANLTPRFYDYNYYFPITLKRTGNNPNLIENPGYN